MMSLGVIGLDKVVISEIYFQVNLHVGFHSVPEETCTPGHQVSTRPISQHVSDDVFSTGSDLAILEFDIASNRCVFTDPISQ